MLASELVPEFPFRRICPEVIGRSPATRFRSVVLPHPLGPTNEINSFLYSLNEISLRESVSQDIV